MSARNGIWRVTVEFSAGCWLGDAARDAAALATTLDREVRAVFNEVPMEAHPGDGAEAVLRRYDTARYGATR